MRNYTKIQILVVFYLMTYAYKLIFHFTDSTNYLSSRHLHGFNEMTLHSPEYNQSNVQRNLKKKDLFQKNVNKLLININKL